MTNAQTTTTPAPDWATTATTLPGDRSTTQHQAITTRAESFTVGLARTDDAEGAGDPIVTVSADMLELFEVEAFTHALHAAVSIARGK